MLRNSLLRAVAAGVAAAAALVALTTAGSDAAGPDPANKIAASGSTIEVTAPNEQVTLLKETIKTSKPADLLLGVTAECAITTELTTVGNDSQEAEGTAQLWIVIDRGTAAERVVPVSTDADRSTLGNQPDDGKVVFCNRHYGRTTSLFDDTKATIETFLRTRSTHGFNWVALDLGSGTHTIEVVGKLVTNATADATATLAVGKRTLVIEPVHAANDEAVTTLG